MELHIAIALIEKGVEQNSSPQVWADLGAGNGLFTSALSTLLSKGSVIHAIDKDGKALKSIDLHNTDVKLNTLELDFTSKAIPLQSFDGIIMANALHYVADGMTFMKSLKSKLKPSGRLIIIEYDRTTSNQWVPYPVSYKVLQHFAKETGFSSVIRLGSQNSIYGNAPIYSAVLK
jgi:2-polyprenyl-3-methyl-5-hydroxy-6-metoxy-1,4-benzoquinol methylase